MKNLLLIAVTLQILTFAYGEKELPNKVSICFIIKAIMASSRLLFFFFLIGAVGG